MNIVWLAVSKVSPHWFSIDWHIGNICFSLPIQKEWEKKKLGEGGWIHCASRGAHMEANTFYCKKGESPLVFIYFLVIS